MQGICWRLETTSRVPRAAMEHLAYLTAKSDKQIERHGARAGISRRGAQLDLAAEMALAAVVDQHKVGVVRVELRLGETATATTQ